MSTIIKTHVSDKAEQFTIGLDHYVGRRVLFDECGDLVPVEIAILDDDEGFVERTLFRLDYDRGDIFVDPALLRPFSDEPIEEPSK